MTHENLNEKTNCNCDKQCDVPQNKSKFTKKKGLLGIMAAMAICCITPLAVGLFAGGAVALPVAAWFGNSALYIGAMAMAGLALWFYLKQKSANTKSG